MFGLNPTALAFRAGGALVMALVIFLLGIGVGRRAEYADLKPKMVAICVGAGSTWDRKGETCLAAVQALARFRTDTILASQKAQREAQAEQDRKAEADQLAERRNAEAQRQAQRNMEKADAAVRGDRVDGAWLRALGELGGLRAPTP